MHGEGHSLIVPADPEIPHSKSRSGLFDNKIVCSSCEARFSEPDRYAKRILLDRRWDDPREGLPDFRQYDVLPDTDAATLKMFALNVLWRAAASELSFFATVRLGPHIEPLTELVRAQVCGGVHDFSVRLARFRPVPSSVGLSPEQGFTNPFRRKGDGINWISIPFNSFVATVKVDSRPAPVGLLPALLSPGNPVIVLRRDFLTSPELRAIFESARARRDQ